MLFLYYPKCSTCQKAKKWLDANHISYEERHIVEENPTYEELKQWYENGDLPLKKFFNTSGMLYKEQKLKDKLPDMSEEDYNMGKIINILPMANREGNLQEIMEALQEVKDALVEVLDQYEEEGAEEKADTLTEALDALEDAYDVINDVVMDEI